MLIHAKVEYGIRALLALADARPRPATTEALAITQQLPARFLGAILTELRRTGIVISQRGGGGGYQLARPASVITVGEVIRALGGPLTEVRGRAPEDATYFGAAAHLGEVWVAVQAAMDELLDRVSLEDVVCGRVPATTRSPAEPEPVNDGALVISGWSATPAPPS
ncbi:MAG TPA: Rrf2 family transcriptional regulator [Acidimicrobiales bacterium]|nr:Rrf2 family transcriptional regulator [Acidimicrobiales bacterium]